MLYLFEKRSTIAEALVSLEMNQRMRYSCRWWAISACPNPNRCNTIDLLFGTPMAYVHLVGVRTIETEYASHQNVLGGLIMGLNTK